MNPVGTRSTASDFLRQGLRTRWNASLPGRRVGVEGTRLTLSLELIRVSLRRFLLKDGFMVPMRFKKKGLPKN